MNFTLMMLLISLVIYQMNVARQVLKNIDKEDSEDVKELLKYPEDIGRWYYD